MLPDEISVRTDIACGVADSTRAITVISAQTAIHIQDQLYYLQTILAMQCITGEVSVIVLLSVVSVWLETLYFDYLVYISHSADVSMSAYDEITFQQFEFIGRFSEAIGQPACFVQNALQNARSIVLNSQAALGRRYMEAELNWRKDLNIILVRLMSNPDLYVREPSRIYGDIDFFVARFAIDAQADGVLMNVSVVKRMSNVIAEQHQQIEGIDYKCWLLEENMANALAQGMEELFNTLSDQFVSWQTNVYEPQIKQFNEQFAGLADNIAEINDKLMVLDELLNLPGDLVAATLDLNEPVRTEQLKKLSNTVQQLYGLDVFKWAALIESKMG